MKGSQVLQPLPSAIFAAVCNLRCCLQCSLPSAMLTIIVSSPLSLMVSLSNHYSLLTTHYSPLTTHQPRTNTNRTPNE